MKKFNTQGWVLFSLLNLFLVALLGTLMRYKIGFEFPFFNQKNLQHAHSHFAFIGWITHTLFVLMVSCISDHEQVSIRKYRYLLVANLCCAYGMLISFAMHGYSGLSITLSTVSILIAFIFAFCFFRDMKEVGPTPYRNWFTAALWFNIISSVGTFALAYMMATHNFNQEMHLASLYYYLHFQYNGFFTFACIGLLVARVGGLHPGNNSKIFWMFFIACIPSYFLSVLWIKLPLWLYITVLASAIAQVVAWIMLLRMFRGKFKLSSLVYQPIKYIFLLIIICMSVKLLLQLGSTVPAISKLAFGFRPVVIAYLHLVLLAIITVFLVTYMYAFNFLKLNNAATAGLIVFVIMVYINQGLLGLQGITTLLYKMVPFMNEMLFFVALLILFSLFLLFVSQLRSKNAGRLVSRK